jgi:tRNA(Ile)-lysidine synthase
MVEALCAELNLKLFTEELEKGFIAAESRKEKQSIEAAARTIRYDYFTRLQTNMGIQYLATGHNMNDHIETMIMRFFQGAGIEGIRGIPDQRSRCGDETVPSYVVIRPLLTVSRSEILSFLYETGSDYISDSTNTSDTYLRNAVRMHLVPEVRKIFPYFETSLLRISSELGEFVSFLSTLHDRAPSWNPVSGGLSLSRKAYLNMHYVMRMRSLYAAYDSWAGGEMPKRLPLRFLKEFDAQAPRMKDGDDVSGHGIRLVREGGYFLWRSAVARNKKKGYLFTVQEEKELVCDEAAGITLLFSEGKTEGAVFTLSKKMICGPLVLRSRRTGDEIITAVGKKPVKKILSDLKVEKHNRDNVPILEDRIGIIAVLCSIYGKRDVCAARCSESYSSDFPVLSCAIRYNGVSG